MGFINDLTPQRPATAATPITDFPDDNAGLSVETSSNNASPEDSPSNAQAGTIETAGILEGGNPTFAKQPGVETTNTDGADDIQKIDWSRPYSEIEQNEFLRQMTPHDIVRDFQKNGNGDYASFMPWLKQFDQNKTVQQSINDQQKAEQQAKWEKWGNLFQHIGNFFGTAMGAPSQTIEDAQALTERQRKIRESTDALRAKGYDQMMSDIYKERQAKQAQMQAEAAAKANEALAAYRGVQKAQEEALTPEKVKTEQAKQGASNAAAAYSTARTKTEDELRGKKGDLITAQAGNQRASAAEHAAGVAVKGAQVEHIHSQTVGQKQKNAAQQEADDFNYNYVNDPTFKKYVNQWARNNHLSVGNLSDDENARGGTWANEKNRQQATKWAKEQMKRDRTPPSKRPNDGGGNKVPPSRRQGAGGGSKVPPSRR